jgi:hypothetical protein
MDIDEQEELEGRVDARRELAADGWTRAQAAEWLRLASKRSDPYARGFDAVVRRFAETGSLADATTPVLP